MALLLAAVIVPTQLCPGLLASDGTPMGTYLCGLAAQGVQEGLEAQGLHLFHLVLVETRLEVPGHLLLLFLLGSQGHQPDLEQGSLQGVQELM